jgi:hypothetical protein
MVTVAELEKQLQTIEQIESYSKDEKADLIASSLAQLIMTIPKEQLASFLKSMMLSDPDMIDHYIDFYKTRILKQYREAIKMARRQPKVIRK